METHRFNLDTRVLSGLLFVVILLMLGLWQPWQDTSDQTITVTGSSVVTEKPDLYTFSPSYSKTADTQQQAITDVSVVGNEVVAKLKGFGIEAKDMKTSVTTNENYDLAPMPMPVKSASGYQAHFAITAKVRDAEVVQKIVDYLATTPVEYAVTPQAEFSDTLKAQLESQARGEALKNAKAKAEETASTLDLQLGKVVNITESNPFGGPIVYARSMMAEDSASSSSPAYEPGENDYTFQVTVEYQIK